MKALASIFILTLSILGLTSCATGTVQAPKQVATIEHMSDDPLNEDTSDPVPAIALAPAPVSSLSWAEQVLNAYGLSLPANTIVAVTPVLGCGPTQPQPYLGGCTYAATASTPTTIVISPELQWTATGEWTLMHELHHAQGNMTDECAADQYARDITQIDIHAYDCEPAPAPQHAAQQATATEHTTTTATQQTATQPTVEATTQPIQTVEPAKTVEPAPPAPIVPSIPPLTDACSEFEVRAEDGSCVPSNYWEVPPTAPPVVCKGNCPTDPYLPPEHSEPNPETPIDCATIQPGEAWAGVGQVCNFNPVGH